MAGSTIFFLVLVGAVGACRLVELRLSRRHQRALAEGGAAVLPEPVFPAMVALHTGILVAAVLETFLLARPFAVALAVPAVALVVLANALRFWVIATLGVHWNVRVVPSMGLGVVTSGPVPLRAPPELRRRVRRAGGPAAGARGLSDRRRRRALARGVLHRRVRLEESVLMADESYRRAFERKPRFLPLPFSSAPRDHRPWPMS